MDFNKVFEDYYDNDKSQEIINIYEKNKIEIINDVNLMILVIESYVSLKNYIEANKLVNEKLPILISTLSSRKLTEEEEENLDVLLQIKIEILFNTKSYLKLLFLLIKHGRLLEDEEHELRMFNIAKRKIYKQLFYLLLAALILSGIGEYLAYIGVIDASFNLIFSYIGRISIGIYFSILLVIKYFQPPPLSEGTKDDK